MTPFPDEPTLLALHARILAGDKPAMSAFARAVTDPLLMHLRIAFPGADEGVRITAAHDAVLKFLHRPSVYVPGRSSVAAYLRMAADGDLRNELAKERRHHRGRAAEEAVELAADDGNGRSDADDRLTFDHPAVVAAIAGFTPVERAVLDLMRAGERRTVAFALLLDLTGEPGEVRREVKRVKDRIMHRLKRAVEGHE